jgi:hypothetical protein
VWRYSYDNRWRAKSVDGIESRLEAPDFQTYGVNPKEDELLNRYAMLAA